MLTPRSEFECRNCPAGEPLRYFVFPRTEVSRASGLPYNVASYIEVTDSQINVVTKEGPADSDLQRIYEFSHDFRLLRVAFGDSYWPQHRLLRLQGKIDHLEEDCPERLPVSILSWTPETGWSKLGVSYPRH